LSDEDDDDDDGSRHSSEAPTIQDDDGFEPEQESDESEDGTPGKDKTTQLKVQWGPEILCHSWTNVEKDCRHFSDVGCDH
jgi:hypothetical protein